MQTATPVKIPVALNPASGFCVKSRSTNDALVRLIAPDHSNDEVHVKKDLKIFVNIAWDMNVPPPPPASDDVIQRAMQGLDIYESDPEAWFIPIVLSDVRQDSDKGRCYMGSVHTVHYVASISDVHPLDLFITDLFPLAGQPAMVFDCVLNPSIKSRCLKDPNFRHFVIELAFQRIEAQTTLVLSRQISTPNIASKGKVQSRRVFVGTTLYPPGNPNHQAPPSPTLIQEIPERNASVPDKAHLKGILKQTSNMKPISEQHIPAWSWTQQGSDIRIVFDVPGATRAVIPQSTLDVEPRRILLHIPALYDLDLNLDASDAELNSIFGKNDTANQALRLKRMRNLDVDNAKAEWRVADKTIVLVT